MESGHGTEYWSKCSCAVVDSVVTARLAFSMERCVLVIDRCSFVDSVMERCVLLIFVCCSGVLPDDKAVGGKLDADGFPPVGAYLQEGDPFYW